MNNTISNIYILHNNVFLFSSIFLHYFKAIESKKNGMLSAYLVLPIITYRPSRNYLEKTIKSNQNIMTMLTNREHVHAMHDRISKYKEITNKTIQYLFDSNEIIINNDLSITICKKEPLEIGSLMHKSSFQLGKLFNPYDVTMLYRLFGVSSL